MEIKERDDDEEEGSDDEYENDNEDKLFDDLGDLED